VIHNLIPAANVRKSPNMISATGTHAAQRRPSWTGDNTRFADGGGLWCAAEKPVEQPPVNL